jgi:hypothetical protein
MIAKNPAEHGLQAADSCMSLCMPQSQATLIESSAPKPASNGGFLHPIWPSWWEAAVDGSGSGVPPSAQPCHSVALSDLRKETFGRSVVLAAAGGEPKSSAATMTVTGSLHEPPRTFESPRLATSSRRSPVHDARRHRWSGTPGQSSAPSCATAAGRSS